MDTTKKQIIVVNSANSLVTDNEVRLMIAACNALMPHVYALWEKSQNRDIYLWSDMTAQQVTSDARRFFIVDDHQSLGHALGMHPEKGVKPDGFVFTRAILANGGTPLDGSVGKPTVAAALFRLLAEATINPSGNLWWNDRACGEFIAARICDPVESFRVTVVLTSTPASASASASTSVKTSEKTRATESKSVADNARRLATDADKNDASADNATEVTDNFGYELMPVLEDVSPTEMSAAPPTKPAILLNTPVSIKSEEVVLKKPEETEFTVSLCNFILPAWCDPATPSGTQVDFLGVLKEPFQIASGGCYYKYEPQSDATPHLIFDRKMPTWKRQQRKVQLLAQTGLL